MVTLYRLRTLDQFNISRFRGHTRLFWGETSDCPMIKEPPITLMVTDKT